MKIIFKAVIVLVFINTLVQFQIIQFNNLCFNIRKYGKGKESCWHGKVLKLKLYLNTAELYQKPLLTELAECFRKKCLQYFYGIFFIENLNYLHVVYTIFHHTRAENTTFVFGSRKRKWYFRPRYGEKVIYNS